MVTVGWNATMVGWSPAEAGPEQQGGTPDPAPSDPPHEAVPRALSHLGGYRVRHEPLTAEPGQGRRARRSLGDELGAALTLTR